MTIQNDIATKLITVNSSLSDIKDAIIEKGVTPTGDITTYADAIGEIAGGGTLESVTVTPSTTAQTITPPSGVDGFDEVNVNAVTASIDNNIQANNIKLGVEILGVTGSYEGGVPVLQDKTLTVSSTTPTIASMNADSGYDGIDTATVDMTYVEDEFDEILGGGTVPIGGIPREVRANGKYGAPASSFTFSLPSSVTDLDGYALYYAFYRCTSLTSVDLSSLTTISGTYAMSYAFYRCTGLTSIDLSSLTTISGTYAMSYAFPSCTSLTSVDLSSLTTISSTQAMTSAFNSCTNLTSVDLSSLTTISGGSGMNSAFEGCTGLTSVDLSGLTTLSGSNAMSYAFEGCTSLTSIDLSSLTALSGTMAMYNAFKNCTGLTSVDLSGLTTVNGNSAMQYAFYGCTSLTSLSFPALTSNSFGSYTNQFNTMLQGVTGCTVHFPSNLEAVIGSWSDVTAGFGGTNTTVLFDLPATT